jgi:aldehyde dehydrogenase (NAD+)
MRPMVVADCSATSSLVAGDHFGPVLAVLPVDGVDHALRVHGASRHRLAVGVYTRSASRWRRDAAFMMRLRASVITFNESVTPTGHPALTIAGSGGSGWGASRGAAGLLELSRPISVTETASWTPAAAPPNAAVMRWMDRVVRWSHRARRVARLVSPPVPESTCNVMQPAAAETESGT